MSRARIIILPVLACAALAADGTSSTNAIAAHAKPHTSERSWRLSLTPAPDDLALAQISFPHAIRPLSRSSVHVAASAPFGEDYLVLAAVTPSATPAVERVLVLVVNRPSPLLDPASVQLHLTASMTLGRAMTSVQENPFARSNPASRPALCDLAHGQALSATQLSTLGLRGAPLPGFYAADAVAQAYDATCSLASASAFQAAVQSSGSAGSPPAPETPSPQPPPTVPPYCTACDPQPGYACPLSASPNICVASVRRTIRSVGAVAH